METAATKTAITAPNGPRSRQLVAWFMPAAIVALGFALRFSKFDELSLWLDEIYVVEYLKLPWRELIGLGATYDNHPPLYFLIVKSVSLVSSDIAAARIVSLATGTLTIAAVYALTRLLANQPAAVVSSLIIAVSPLHIWYSQEGRMYAPALLAVTLSYYALFRFLPSGDRRWGAIYGATLVAAAYLDYSAFYALAPHAGVAAYFLWGHGWRTIRPWLVAVALAAICYLPWVARILESIDFVGQDRAFLLVTRQKLVDSFFTIVGLPGDENYYWGMVSTPWARWPEIRPTSAALVISILIFSAITLSGKYRPSFVAGVALLLGTFGAASALSYWVSPGFADRTVVYALVGWAILAGAAPFGRVPNGGRWLSLSAIAALLVFSGLAVWSVRDQATKEMYRDLAYQVEAASVLDISVVSSQRPEEPLIADSTGLISTALTAYHPDLAPLPVTAAQRVAAFWHVYTDYPWEVDLVDHQQQAFHSAGYARVWSRWFSPVLYLDLYVSEHATIGHQLDLPPMMSITGPGSNPAPVWQFSEVASQVHLLPNQREELVIFGSGEDVDSARVEIRAAPDRLYMVSLDSRFLLPFGSMTLQLQCLGGDSTITTSSEVNLSSSDMFDPRVWTRTRAAVLCPGQSVELGISINVSDATEIGIRSIRLSELTPLETIAQTVHSYSPAGRPGLVAEL